jgi:hypothetical protein
MSCNEYYMLVHDYVTIYCSLKTQQKKSKIPFSILTASFTTLFLCHPEFQNQTKKKKVTESYFPSFMNLELTLGMCLPCATQKRPNNDLKDAGLRGWFIIVKLR